MSTIISNLTVEAHNELGLGEEMKIKNCDIAVEVFYSETIFLPLIIMLTNALHYRATGKSVIPITGKIVKSGGAPFGLTLDGDLDLKSIEIPVGMIKQCIKTTLRTIYPIVKNDLFENLSNHLLSEVIADLPNDSVINESMYIKEDLLVGIL
ncbi:hypothetical protein VCHA53O466_40406 [Vibrio chagasii]|nr:hypothetical protein VCHA53O466_40406 [Vibrio chagasii]